MRIVTTSSQRMVRLSYLLFRSINSLSVSWNSLHVFPEDILEDDQQWERGVTQVTRKEG